MRRLLFRFFDDISGATAIEYCLIATGISVVIVAAVNGIGVNLRNPFISVRAGLE